MNLNIITQTKLFAIAFTFISMNMLAQITVTDADLMNVGDVVYTAIDSLPSNSIAIGNAGANQTWDFSALQAQEYDTTEFIDPVGTPFGADHPSANLCIDDNGQYIYIDKNGQGLNLVGLDNLPYPKLILPLPLTYGLNIIVGPSTTESVFANPGFLDHSLAPVISLNPLHNQIDSVKSLSESLIEFNVDAYGVVIIPMGTFDALRLKTDDITTTDFFAYCSDTIFGNGGWYPMAGIFPSEVEVVSSYQWWTNDPLIKFVLVQMDIDSAGNIEEVGFMHSPSPSSVTDLSSNNFNIYPIPATNNLTIEAQNNDFTSLNLVDVTGKVILKKEFTQSTSLDVSHIAKGMYYLNLKTDEGKLSKQIIIE